LGVDRRHGDGAVDLRDAARLWPRGLRRARRHVRQPLHPRAGARLWHRRTRGAAGDRGRHALRDRGAGLVRRAGLDGQRRRRAIAMLRSEPITVAAEIGNGSHATAADTIPFAVWCAATHLTDYSAALWACGEVGGDIDTTCAIVGGIVVGAVGVGGIPDAWRA